MFDDTFKICSLDPLFLVSVGIPTVPFVNVCFSAFLVHDYKGGNPFIRAKGDRRQAPDAARVRHGAVAV